MTLSCTFPRYHHIYSVTAGDLEKSFIFEKTVDTTSHTCFPIHDV